MIRLAEARKSAAEVRRDVGLTQTIADEFRCSERVLGRFRENRSSGSRDELLSAAIRRIRRQKLGLISRIAASA